jgi:hypothetical protein
MGIADLECPPLAEGIVPFFAKSHARPSPSSSFGGEAAE